MSDLSVGNHADVVLNAGDVLRVSTGGVSTVVVAYGAPAGTTTITANTQDFGPYSVPAKLAVNAVTGTASYSNVAAYPVVKMPDGTLQAGGSPVDGGGNSGPTAIAFSTTVPLDGNKSMALSVVAGAVALTIGSKVVGGACRVQFRTDGTNVPSISGASEWSSSFGYDNSQAGLLDVLDVWTDDGTNAYYAWSQPAVNTPVATPVAPAFSAAPVILGTPAVGTPVSYTSGTITGSPTPTSSQQWTLDGADISGATGSTYTPVSGDATHALRVRQIATNSAGTANSTSAPATVAASDVTAPTVTSAAVANATPTIVTLTFSEPMDTGFLPASSAVTIGGHTVSSVAFADSTHLSVTVSAAFVNGEAARTAAYTQPGTNNLRDLAGNLLANFTGQAITNSVGSGDTSVALVLSPLVSLTTSDNLSYLGGAGASYANYGRTGALTVPANTDVYLEISHEVTSNSAVVIGLATAAGPTDATLPKFQVQVSTAASNIRQGTDVAVGSGTVIQALTAATGKFVRMRRSASGACTVLVSTDNKATWTVIATLTGTYTGALYPAFYTITGNTIRNPRQIGMA